MIPEGVLDAHKRLVLVTGLCNYPFDPTLRDTVYIQMEDPRLTQHPNQPQQQAA